MFLKVTNDEISGVDSGKIIFDVRIIVSSINTTCQVLLIRIRYTFTVGSDDDGP